MAKAVGGLMGETNEYLTKLLSLGIFTYCNCHHCKILFQNKGAHQPILKFKNSEVSIWVWVSKKLSLNGQTFQKSPSVKLSYFIGCPIDKIGGKEISNIDLLENLSSEDQDVVIFNMDLFTNEV